MFLALGNVHSPSVLHFLLRRCQTRDLLNACSIAGTILKAGSEKENEIGNGSDLELIF